MDWYSRHVLPWKLSNTLDTAFCLEALEEALAEHRPDIFNTDQGSQYTSMAFTSRLQRQGIAISMDAREHRHQGLENRTPWEVFHEQLKTSRSNQTRGPICPPSAI